VGDGDGPLAGETAGTDAVKVLVTGATGQLGHAVANALAERGDDVRCLVRDPLRPGLLEGSRLEVAPGDVVDPEALRMATAGCEAVVHLAGIVSYRRSQAAHIHAINAGGTQNILDAAADTGVRRVLLTSSIAALGYVDGDGEGDEDTTWNWGPLDIGYLESKRAAEALVLGDSRVEGVAVNPGVVFGAGDLHLHAGRMLVQVHQGKVPAAPPGATTAASLDDVVAGHLAALDRGLPGRRYVLGGAPLPFLELYRAIGEVVGRAGPSRVAPAWLLRMLGSWRELVGEWRGIEPDLTRDLAEMAVRNRRYSSARAIEELGYKPSPITAGIEACWRYYRDTGRV
jgi:dihydroflavonol-4-reductase